MSLMVRLTVSFGVWLACLPLAIAAQPEAPEVVPTSPVGAGDMVQVTLGLFAVLVIIGGLAWVVKRMGRFQSLGSGAIQVVGGVSLSQRERIVLLQVGNEQLLIGVAPGTVQTLHVLNEPIAPISQDNSARVTGFAERLSQVMARGKQ